MLKILSPNDDDDDTKLVRISRPHTSEFPSRTLLSNSVVEKADFIPMEGAILERRNKRVFTTTIDHEDKLPDGDVGEGELNLSSLMPARYVGTEEATQEKKKAKTE